MKFTEIHGILQSAMSLKGPKVSFLLPYGNDRHRLGVNKILLSQDQNTIYTAGRDGCLKSWNLPQDGSNPAPVLNIQAHYDWINDMFLTKTSDESPIAVTCSNDSIIQFWNLEKSTNLATYRIHNDYIRCMAYSQFANTFISCGLDSTIYFSDLEKAIASGKQNSYEPTKISLKSSIYACALNDAFSLCVTGGTDTFLRLHDPKSLKKICKLRGHSDNIHSILMSQDGNRIVSAGSDRLIKLWDVRVQKCLYTVTIHEDTVFSLKFNGTEDVILSGGKDGYVYQTDFTKLESNLICKETKPILSLESKSDLGCFVSTTSSDVSIWDFEMDPKLKTSVSRKSTLTKTPTNTPQKEINKKPIHIYRGTSGITKSYVLNNKTKVVTVDTDGVVCVWDVRKGLLERCIGVVNVEEKVKELNEVISVDNWFTTDNKLGCLQILLDPPRCFNSEVYALEGGFPESSPDDKVNYGQLMTVALFRNWYEKRPEPTREEDVKKYADRKKRDEKLRFELPQDLTLIIHHEKENRKFYPFIIKNGDFDGSELLHIPEWVNRCYMGDSPEGTTNHKITFMMESFDPKQLENFASNKLTAHRILRVTKVCDYVVTNLKLTLPKKDELDLFRSEVNKETLDEKKLKLMESYVSKLKKKGDGKDAVKPEEFIEVLCNGHIIAPHYNMGIIYTFFRENQPMVILKYRVKL